MKGCEDAVNYIVGFQRCRSITAEDVRGVLMSVPGRWFSLSEVVAFLSDKIAPEEAVRFFDYYRNGRKRSGQPSNAPLLEKIERGKRHLLRQKLTGMHTAGYIERKARTKNSEALYRVKSKERTTP